MFYVRDNRVECAAQNIGRDYLGSITHIATEDGTLLAEYSYDPWGRMRNPQTQVLYAGGTEPELLLGRGYTGHEHLKQFGLINMNARLYDPYLGRFLSPDPYVQAPDFTQNFNRYSYALNNPLKYTDESGEELLTILGAVLLGALISSTIDYGIQVAVNAYVARHDEHLQSLTKEQRRKWIWSGNVDWFDVALSGIIGGLTVGVGVAAQTTGKVGKAGVWILQHQKLITAGEIALTSAVDITGEGVQEVTGKQFIQRFATGLATMAVRDLLTKVYSSRLQTSSDSFFDNTKYSDEVLTKKSEGDYHDFPELIKEFEPFGTRTIITGGDGKVYELLIIPGYINNQEGQYEFIKNAEGIITHRFFKPK